MGPHERTATLSRSPSDPLPDRLNGWSTGERTVWRSIREDLEAVVTSNWHADQGTQMNLLQHVISRSAPLLGMVALLAACADVNAPQAAVPEPASVVQRQQEAVLGKVAQGFARALAEAPLREHVRDEMRASLLTEHKLVLQEFVSSPRGREVLEAAANALGITPAALGSMVAGLPEMDFYAPFREHRRTWRATPDVVVAAALDTRGSEFQAYTIDGVARKYDVRHGAPAEAVLMIHPAQRKSSRIDPQAASPGSVIQEAGDGELSGTVGWRRNDGRVVEVELAALLRGDQAAFDVLMECDPTAKACLGDGGGSPSAPADTTFLDYLWVNYYDGIAGSNELEFTSRYYINGSESATGFLRIEGVYPFDHRYPHLPLIFRRMREGANEHINVAVVETDPFFNDDKGNRDFFQSYNGQTISITKGTSITNVQLGWVPKY
jgi:hypothetical protein